MAPPPPPPPPPLATGEPLPPPLLLELELLEEPVADPLHAEPGVIVMRAEPTVEVSLSRDSVLPQVFVTM